MKAKVKRIVWVSIFFLCVCIFGTQYVHPSNFWAQILQDVATVCAVAGVYFGGVYLYLKGDSYEP